MYIYNVTVNIEESIKEKWLEWIKEHIPHVLATGCFISAKLTRVLTTDANNGLNYSIQYTAKTYADLDNYYNNYAEKLRKDGSQLFADKMLAFRTELEVIDEYTVSK